MKKALATFVLTLALAGPALFAQTSTGTRGNPIQHRISFLTTLLSLSTSQQQEATTIFTNAATADTSIHASMKSARQALKTAVQANDANGIAAAATTIGNLTAQETTNRGNADAAFWQILTPAQQTKLNQFESQPHGRGMGGPGFGPGRF